MPPLGLDPNSGLCCRGDQGSRSRETLVFAASARSLTTSATASTCRICDQRPPSGAKPDILIRLRRSEKVRLAWLMQIQGEKDEIFRNRSTAGS